MTDVYSTINSYLFVMIFLRCEIFKIVKNKDCFYCESLSDAKITDYQTF